MKASEILSSLGVKDPKILNAADEKLRVKTERKQNEVRFQANPEFKLEGSKLPNQAKFLVQAIQKTKEPVTYVQWGKIASELGMGTRQDPARIAAYYRKQLIDAGAVKQV